jgi:hypothetical protein
MSFSRHLLSSVLIAGTVLAAATLPLATLGAKPVAVQLEGKPVFTGQFKELAGPYLGLALALSIGAGVTNLAVMRWYQASRELGLAEQQLSGLQQRLNEKEALLESLQFSPARLQANGLERFSSDMAGRMQRAQLGTEPTRNGSEQAVSKSST